MLANVAAAGILAAGTPLDGELQPATLAAFDRYVALTEARISKEVGGASPFLWINQQPEPRRSTLLAELNRGGIISEPLRTRDGKKEIDANGALIHHWVGTVLLPGVKLTRVRPFVENYERYPALFSPTIQRAKILNRSGDQFLVQMRTYMKKVVTVVIDADYRIDYRQVGSSRLHTKSVASNLFLVDSAGEPAEKRTPVAQTVGWLWRLNNYCSFEETSDGTIEQCESISLTRGYPFGTGWFIKPFVNSIPRETMEFTLGKVRSEVGKQ
jgi:hypothetical protein